MVVAERVPFYQLIMAPAKSRWRARPAYACLIMLLQSTNLFMFRPALQLFVLNHFSAHGGTAPSATGKNACNHPNHHADTADTTGDNGGGGGAARAFDATPAQERHAVSWDMALNLAQGIPAVLLAGTYGCASDRLGRRVRQRFAEHFRTFRVWAQTLTDPQLRRSDPQRL